MDKFGMGPVGFEPNLTRIWVPLIHRFLGSLVVDLLEASARYTYDTFDDLIA